MLHIDITCRLSKYIFLMGMLISSISIACGNSNPTTEESSNDSFSYAVRVQTEGTFENISNAIVTIEVSELAPLQGQTDTNGFTRIFVDNSYINKPARLLVVANNYKPYQREIDLVEGSLPDTIPLSPIPVEAVSPQISTPTTNIPSTPVEQSMSTINSGQEANLSGVWDFQINSSQKMGRDGFIRDAPASAQWVIRLNQADKQLNGELIGAQNACTNASIVGTVQGSNINFLIQYRSSCCYGEQMKFEGTLNADSKTLIGSIKPVDIPKTNCELWFADVTATKR